MIFKKLWQAGGIGVLCLIATLGLYEVTLRLVFPPPQLIDIRKLSTQEGLAPVAKTKLPGTFVPWTKLPNPLYLETAKGRRLRPNVRAKLTNHPFSGLTTIVETNSLGYRSHEVGSKFAKRILFLGDSITLSEHLHESDTFVRQVERLSVGLSEPLETINAGVSGESLQSYLYLLEESGISVAPDLVVVGLYLNDFQSSRSIQLFYPPDFLRDSWAMNYLFHIFSKKYATVTRRRDQWSENRQVISDAKLAEWSQRVDCCFSKMEGPGEDVVEFKKLVRTNIEDWGGAWSEDAWDGMAKTLLEIKTRLDQSKIPLVIVLFPVSYQVEMSQLFTLPQRKGVAIAQQFGVPVLDMLPSFRAARSQSSERVFYDQCHPTAYASRIIARDVLTFLIDRGLVARL